MSSGALYDRCSGSDKESFIPRAQKARTDGFTVTGRYGSSLYSVSAELDILNNNAPLETGQLTLVALVERDTLFYSGEHVNVALFRPP